MRARTAPKKEGLSPFECSYERPFLRTDIVIDPEALELTNYVTQLSAFQQALTELQEMTQTQPLSQVSLYVARNWGPHKNIGVWGLIPRAPLGKPLPGYSFFSHSCQSIRN